MNRKYFDLSGRMQSDPAIKRVTGEDGKRYYSTPNGVLYPSVTTVLSSMGGEAIARWKARVGEEEAAKISNQASVRGTEVHMLVEKYLQNDEKWNEGAMPSNIATFNQIKPFLDEHCAFVYGNEMMLYSDELRSGGTLDLFARIFGINTIADVKTSKKKKREEWITNYFYQCAAYAIMVYERTGAWCPQIVLIIATDSDGLQIIVKQTEQFVGQTKQYFNEWHQKNVDLNVQK